MKAVIIAGGPGTRLRPLTYNTPKPIIPFFDKPFLVYQLEYLKKYGINEVIINTHYLHTHLKDILKDGSDLYTYLRDLSRLRTGHTNLAYEAIIAPQLGKLKGKE